MRYELASFFEDPEFQESLKKYEDMVKSHVPVYFDGEELTDVAEYYASKGREDEADEAVSYGLRLHPDDIDLLIFKARSFTIKGKTDEARRVMSLITDTQDREVKFLTFDILHEEGKDDEADQVLDDLAAEEDYSKEVMVDVMQMYLDVDRYDKAKEWYERVDKAFDVNKLIRSNRRMRSVFCDYYFTVRESEKCLPLLQEMVDENPYSVPLWNDLTRCYIDLGEEEKAHEAVDFSLAIDDQDGEALQLKATCYRLSGNLTESVRMLERAVELGKQFPAVNMQLAQTYLDLRRFKDLVTLSEAIEKRLPEEVEEMDPDLRELLLGYLAIGYIATKQVKKGMEYLGRLKGIVGEDSEEENVHTYMVTGFCSLLLGVKEVAQQAFQSAMDMAKKEGTQPYFEVLFDISGIYFDYKQMGEACDVYKRMIKEFPEDSCMVLYMAMYTFVYSQQTKWFFHCLARIRKELPDLYEKLGTVDDLHDEEYNRCLLKMKESVANGEIDLDKHLKVPEI
jgi:tetratricopeptide (TPR) repeat protein